MAKLPAGMDSLFWDIDIRALDPKKHARYVIERVMEYGDARAVKWLFNFFPQRQLKAVVDKSRSLSSKSRRFWELILSRKSAR